MAAPTDVNTSSRSGHVLAISIATTVGLVWAWAGSQDGIVVGGFAVFALAIVLAFAINWLAFVPSYLAGTEHYYDLVGSLTYLTVTIITLLLSGNTDFRSLLLGGLVIIWSARLGTFLFARIRKSGKDDRFDNIKTNPIQFLMAWTLQALWVTMTAGAALAAISTVERPPIGLWLWLGLVVWAFGFGFEIVADRQKSAFKADPANDGRFINVGLWSVSRHPNYFGEITLWVGVAIIAFPVLSGAKYLMLLSPVFVAALLIRGSGIPLLERKADKRWGNEEAYQEYKANTPVLVPRLPR